MIAIKRCTILIAMKKAITCLTALLLSLSIWAAGGREYTSLDTSAPIELTAESTIERSVSISSMLYSLGNLYSFLDSYYLGEIDNKAMEEELVAAMVSSLGDEYSYYIPSSEAEEYNESSEGSYIGLGLYLTKYNPTHQDPSDPSTMMVIIQAPFPGGPADRAGLRPHDMISHINGEDVAPMSAVEASRKLRGEAGKDITITVHRSDAVFDLTLRPERVSTPSTQAGMIADDIGYIRIFTFSLSTADSFEKELGKLLDSGAEKLIIDLRNNGGGTVQSALRIADMFLDDGTLLITRYKDGSGRKESIIDAMAGTEIPHDVPVAILVNGGTASSSEILTGALSDNGRATVIGSTTFGKGISQEVRPFSEGYIQVTTGHFFTPDGSDIHHVGITPDIIIEEEEYSDEDMKAFSSFMEDADIEAFVEEHPDYSYENVRLFVSENAESGVPDSLLELLVRNEYLYSMDWEDRPVAEPGYDKVLKAAMEVLGE